MRASTDTLTTEDGVDLFVNRWLPDGPAKAVVQLVHGMAEHSTRYARFAEGLTDHGYAVYAVDLRGHGGSPGTRGFFASANGWDTMLEDLRALTRTAKEEQPGLPFFMFGHSMGSWLARAYAAGYGSELTGLVLTGTAGHPGLQGRAGHLVARVQARLRGAERPSALLDKLTFSRNNNAFKPARTGFDWLSRDEAEVDKYVADPQSGFVFTAGGYVDISRGLAAVNTDALVSTIPKTLPIHLESGAQDPVAAIGKGVEGVAAQLRRLGVRDVTVTMWPDARHEILNETNRDEVEASIIGWLDAHLPA